MDKLHHKISFLEGLSEGLDLKENQKEGRILVEVIQLCKAMVDQFELLKVHIDEQDEYMEAIDDDLNDLETFIFENWENEQGIKLSNDEDEEGNDEEYYEVECPNCEELVLVPENYFYKMDTTDLICPECHEIIVLDEEISMEDPLIETYKSPEIYKPPHDTTQEHFYSP